MTEKQYRLNKWGTRLLKNNRPLFDWTNEADEIVDLLNKLNDKNEQLRKDATTLIYANQDYRQQNQNLQEQLDYIQNSISEHIKHQKTELGQKALREVIQDYNDWLLGHKEVKE